ncbi:hypothetical protein D3C77_313650 [compost metagenome]
MVIVDPIDQADALRLFSFDRTPGVGQLAHDAIANDTRQALQRTDVGRHAHVDFLDRELCVAAAVAHVAGRDQVDGATDAVALDRCQHRLAAVVHGIERGLHTQDGAAQQARIAADVLAQLIGQRRQHHQVDAGGEVFARAADDHRADRIGVIDPFEDLDDFAPERRVHRVVLFRAVDLHMGDAVLQLDLECLVLSHGALLEGGENNRRTISSHPPGRRPRLCQNRDFYLDLTACIRHLSHLLNY